MDKTSYLLLLGSNQGIREQQLKIAIKKIGEAIGNIEKKSSVYETAAWGKTNQPSFLNQALQVTSVLDAYSLLDKIQAIEKEMGRTRIEKWGVRPIDIDILFAESLILHSPGLTIPHPAIPQRRFTLATLVEIVPEFVHPESKKTIQQLMTECSDPLSVVRITS